MRWSIWLAILLCGVMVSVAAAQPSPAPLRLVDQLTDPDPVVYNQASDQLRSWLEDALRDVSDDSLPYRDVEEVLSRLMRALNVESAITRGHVEDVLRDAVDMMGRELGRGLSDHKDRIADLLRGVVAAGTSGEGDMLVRRSAEKISQRAVAKLGDAAQRGGRASREASIDALSDSVRDLTRALRSSDSRDASNAEGILDRTIDVLKKLLANPDPRTRLAALGVVEDLAESLQRVVDRGSPRGKRVAERLLRAIDSLHSDSDGDVRRAADRVIRKLRP